ncbi:MAG: HI0074 family nucleotidyltransferase substrate-binding subunit [Clostridiaceae bacterium]
MEYFNNPVLQKKILQIRFEYYKKTYDKLQEAATINMDNPLIVDATIHRFECALESSCKLMKLFLDHNGIKNGDTIKDTVESASDLGLLDTNEWYSMIADKNKILNTININDINMVYDNIKTNYLFIFETFSNNIEQHINL